MDILFTISLYQSRTPIEYVSSICTMKQEQWVVGYDGREEVRISHNYSLPVVSQWLAGRVARLKCKYLYTWLL